MPARSGQQYIESLKRRKPCVYLGGRRVVDVTEEPILQEPMRAIAELYDMQLDPAYREVMTFCSPSSGDPVSTSFLVPRSRAELIQKRQHCKLRADHNFGFLGRGPDFMNCFVTGWSLAKQHFARGKPEYGENAVRYHEFARENDLFLTHMLINPQIDRSRTSAQQEDPFLHLGKVGETSEGIVVRGAKMLGTMAPLTEEVAVIPYGGVAPGDDAYAVTFSIPIDTPGMKFICRETVSPLPRSRFDHPLSSRFEEMDCIAIFEDVVVPWERVLVDGSPGSGAIINPIFAAVGSTTELQIAARMLSQMEFFCGLATKLADCIGITGFLHVQEKLGEMLSYLEIARAVFYGTEATAQPGPDGVWLSGGLGGRAFHLHTPQIYARFVEIVQSLAGGGFFYAPSEADLLSPEIRPYVDKFVRGRPGISAEERVSLFKLAWDVTGESFAQRMQQYVRFYSGDPIRNMAGFYLQYDKEPLSEIVERALGRREGTSLPISSERPGARPRYRPPPGAMAGAYPAGTQPQSTVSGARPAGGVTDGSTGNSN
ncbi:MAG TPA: 4-hydroxyphenylacetate 3-hydroxylase N-terminal domain-containing protein [Dehalococcoidia bacterium]|nr:4-hydroxyphenylacetate 3-hydroxylase N-terminal domain-containing protein [Dehalococcoidia bacterium]